MDARKLTITGALTGAAGLLIWRFGDLVPDAALIWGAFVLGSSLFSLFFSWAATEVKKRMDWPRDRWGDPDIKRRIMLFAMGSAGTMQLLMGVVLTLIGPGLGTRAYVVILVMWLVWSAGLAVFSPFLWRWTFEVAVPRLNRMVSGRDESIRYDAQGNPKGIRLEGEEKTRLFGGDDRVE